MRLRSAPASIALGNETDVDRAVAAAKESFVSFSQTKLEERIELLEAIIEAYKVRLQDLAATVASEMGAPISLANGAQAPAGLGHLTQALAAAREFPFEEASGRNQIVREPVGVVV